MAKLLPQAFTEKMELLLGDEFAAFMASYEQPRWYGLRVNTLKASADAFARISPFALQPVPWAEDGFYYGDGDRPGKHPYYHAGLYYIQEPSAMAPAALLDVQPGDRVLDLCAAPGGKSTQIAARLAGQGVLVSNDIQAERVKALMKNLAVFGVRNAVGTNETPDGLLRRFAGYFNKVAIDAPCSGEGMFRKDDNMIASWETHSVTRCAAMQADILDTAARLLAPGGLMVYSTCTFAPEENELSLARFLDKHREFSVVPVDQADRERYGFAAGRPEWLAPPYAEAAPALLAEAATATGGAVRLWPHRIRGEGHFVALLRHNGPEAGSAEAGGGVDAGASAWAGASASAPPPVTACAAADVQTKGPGPGPGATRRKERVKGGAAPAASAPDLLPWFDFMADNLTRPLEGRWVCYGSSVYWTNWDIPDLSGLKVARPGWFVGTLKKNRCEPSHALALGLRREDALRRIDLESDDPDVVRYLRGDTLELSAERMEREHSGVPLKGYCLVCVDGYPLGWGKWLDGILKNEYPPGWRWT